MRYGIPKYRLPRDILDAEISRILDIGITLELNATVTDIQAELEAGFDAAFVAAGAHIGRRAYIPAGDSTRIMDAVSMLHGMEDGAPPMLGRRVAVYGGGNTAMDAARTARRLGASEAVGHPRTHTTWHQVAPQLAGSFFVVCPDLRGYGRSTLPPDAPGHAQSSRRARPAT